MSSQQYKGPELPVYHIVVNLPRYPITEGLAPPSVPPNKPPPSVVHQPAPRPLASSYTKVNNSSVRKIQTFYDRYVQMCDGIMYNEAAKLRECVNDSNA